MSEKKGLPAWQRRAADPSIQAPSSEHDATPSAIDRVRKFLQDPAVKDASPDKKRAFLLSKDISEDAIDRLMTSADSERKDTDADKDTAIQDATGSTTDASTEAAQQEFDASKTTPQPQAYVRTTDGSQDAAKQEFDASKAVSFSPTEFRAANPSTTPAPPPQQPRRDIPPIVTYPEFLVQPQKPPPLVTVSRLINATYIAGALTASAYALSKYIIAPMADNLNDARHDLFEHTSDYVDDFNDRLSEIVSTIPSQAKSFLPNTAESADFDMESVTSDPTELFHRDVGTQTSPSLSRRTSLSSDTDVVKVKPDTVPVKQATRLEIIKSHLAELLEGTESNGASNQTLQESVGETRQYLDGLYYTPPSYSWNADNTLNTNGAKDKQPDAAVALKAEIRGVKGVLLSAKRFPSVGRVGA
ncbi:hypothetical protein AUEXF2481DRAFT_537845 [Aureobasidium subglaciale EXF-2481]|uniref:Peroxisomal membrane protein PEX14 n=1 Tax=Aureobasidium subglaciale (strain EXF-2481) TaxID=1043005 RepID=A0A074YIN5_AURSE|nr:uncharacterized protein AUEXF2481DRAFT_537845 [Aureobasidium subglaciale EXF-2481]KAI5195061.1 hypothetical protein E4T38_09253 [Aureobasidium subglaciale]KAI5214129.1 hypothetical protein E4T40_09204 [Aureobasidium subglaciale]KAI5216584.1 hypothetical protein E4T41_09205 [Aureobasidium subglaciale]KAI5254442.1 hypothetical protein E4T46_09160 [Aureobasidium subglaciale]KEQ97628.1 hypothetical protein AUEXF2481DRAFT_537845 [Aureobasidium subglaciale EXF-2481]